MRSVVGRKTLAGRSSRQRHPAPLWYNLGMSREAKPQLSARIGRVVLIVFLLYPLSLGPASRLALGTRWEPVLVIYEPIERLHGIGWPFDDIMKLYVKAWRAIAG
jgi:hypothetical protein